MTQDSDRQSSSSNRRSARAGRNRPMLVTSQESEGIEETNIEEKSSTPEQNVNGVEAENTPIASPKRRMPAFFSTIGKRTQTEESQEVDQAQARIARATRGKSSSTKTSSEDNKEQKPEVKKEPASRSAAPKRPASPFKTKYLIGIGIYLLAANFIGALETNTLRSYHLDAVLTQFTLFGGKIVISTSTLVFLATLVIILVALARFDLIPRNFSAIMGGQTTQQNRRGSSNQGTTEGSRNNSPTRKQGVSGANDDLYQEYRANQKRAKKK
jgi:hypothetical protein